MAAHESTPLILFSGLAADANVFIPQKIAFPQLIVPGWPTPLPDDTLDSYCERLAGNLRPHGRAIIGGASFGGIVALCVAQHLNPRAVLLIGSARSPAELSRITRLARPLTPLLRFLLVRLLQTCCAPLASNLARRAVPHLCGLARQFRGADPTVFRWSLARILDWTASPNLTCPILHIHGDRDFVLPIRYTQPDTIVAGGGHVISLTHPSDVNDFIRSAVLQAVGEPPRPPEPGLRPSSNGQPTFPAR